MWASNRDYAVLAKGLCARDRADFLELFIDPDATPDMAQLWKDVSPDCCLHAPHSMTGFNPAIAELADRNLALFEKIGIFHETVRPRMTVFHPGLNGDARETIRQFKSFSSRFPRIFSGALIENKPAVGLNGERTIGSSPEEISIILRETGLGFCLDFGHALCHAASMKVPWQGVVESFMRLRPSLFHLSDGVTASPQDAHLHIGQGDYDMGAILAYMPDRSWVTVETPHDFKDRLNDFETDIARLKGFLNHAN